MKKIILFFSLIFFSSIVIGIKLDNNNAGSGRFKNLTVDGKIVTTGIYVSTPSGVTGVAIDPYGTIRSSVATGAYHLFLQDSKNTDYSFDIRQAITGTWFFESINAAIKLSTNGNSRIDLAPWSQTYGVSIVPNSSTDYDSDFVMGGARGTTAKVTVEGDTGDIISSNTVTAKSIKLTNNVLGALPTSGYASGTIFYSSTTFTFYGSTETVAGTQSWVRLGKPGD